MTSRAFRFRHIIWDWNGTLIDDLQLSVNGFCATLESIGVPPISVEHYRNTVRHPVRDWLNDLGVVLDSDEDFGKMSRLYHEFYMAGRANCELHSGARQTLRELCAGGVESSILSAHPQSFVESGLRHFQIDHYFKYVFGASDELGRGKIEEGRALLERIELDPESVVLIGDMDHDHEVASALGIECILVAHGLQSFARLEACRTTIAKDFDEVRTALLAPIAHSISAADAHMAESFDEFSSK